MWFVTTNKYGEKDFSPEMEMECGPAGFEFYPSMGRANKNENGNGVWARQDSNLRPSDYESPALTAAPRAR